jgi:hypothetical protein
MEIVDSDTKQMDAGGHQQPQHHQQNQRRDFDPYGGGAGGGNKINDSIMVPSDAVGMIIGKGRNASLQLMNVVLILFRWRDYQANAVRDWLQDQRFASLRCRY